MVLEGYSKRQKYTRPTRWKIQAKILEEKKTLTEIVIMHRIILMLIKRNLVNMLVYIRFLF